MVAFTSKKVIIYSLYVVIFSVVMPAQAALPVRNLGVFSQYIGTPDLQPAKKLRGEQMQWSMYASQNSHFANLQKETDKLLVDTESTVVDLSWRGVIADVEVLLVLPWVNYRSGFLDKTISGFHHALDLPNGNRSTVKNNQFAIRYEGEDTVYLDSPGGGLGDVRVQGGWQLHADGDYHSALHASIKLPTGNDDKLLGSGAADFAVFASHAWTGGNWHQELQYGAIKIGEGYWQRQQRSAAVFVSAALSKVLNDGWKAVIQYDAHSAYYRNTHQPTFDDAHMLTIGAKLEQKRFTWHVALVEDMKVYSTPDVGFQLGFEWQ